MCCDGARTYRRCCYDEYENGGYNPGICTPPGSNCRKGATLIFPVMESVDKSSRIELAVLKPCQPDAVRSRLDTSVVTPQAQPQGSSGGKQRP
jgi:hypothetical protein